MSSPLDQGFLNFAAFCLIARAHGARGPLLNTSRARPTSIYTDRQPTPADAHNDNEVRNALER